MNTGAQMCVTQRVRKMIGVVRVRSSGEKAHRAGVEEVARVIERHDHHDQPAQRVERRQARVRCRGAH